MLIIENIFGFFPRKESIKLYRLYKNLKSKPQKFEIELPSEFDYLKHDINLEKISKNRNLSGTMFTMNVLMKTLKIKH